MLEYKLKPRVTLTDLEPLEFRIYTLVMKRLEVDTAAYLGFTCLGGPQWGHVGENTPGEVLGPRLVLDWCGS